MKEGHSHSRNSLECILGAPFDKFWEIPKREEGSQLKGIALGVAQYVVGTLELEEQEKGRNYEVLL